VSRIESLPVSTVYDTSSGRSQSFYFKPARASASRPFGPILKRAHNECIQAHINDQSSAKSGVYGEVWSELLRRSLDQTADLVDLLAGKPTQTPFPDTAL
jgi:hypothetical protein